MRTSSEKILLRPILTEKSTSAIERLNAYAFEVAPGVNKIEIRKAVETLFDVKVIKVNVRNRGGKRKRVGRSIGFSRNSRHAIVTVRPGDKIDVY